MVHTDPQAKQHEHHDDETTQVHSPSDTGPQPTTGSQASEADRQSGWEGFGVASNTGATTHQPSSTQAHPTPGAGPQGQPSQWDQQNTSTGPQPQQAQVAQAPEGESGSKSSRILWIAAAASAAVAIGAVGAYLFWPEDEATVPTIASQSNVYDLGNNPSLKWQASTAQLAPNLGCTSTNSTDSTDDSCYVAADTVGDRVLAMVSKSTTSTNDAGETVSTSKTTVVAVGQDGKNQWSINAAEGKDLSCIAGQNRLWCLTSKSPTGTESSAGPSTLETYDLGNGKKVGSVSVPGAAESASWAGTSADAVYVSGTNDAQSSTYTLTKSGEDGKAAWNRIVTESSDSSGIYAQADDGKVYTSATSAGKAVVLNDADGKPVSTTAVRINGVVQGKEITQQVAGGALSVGDKLTAYDSTAFFSSYDSETPLVMSADSSTDSDSTYSLVNADDPGKDPKAIQGQPRAFCHGVLITESSGSEKSTYLGINPDDASVKWQYTSDDPATINCASDSVLFSAGASLVGINPDNGDQSFTTAVPQSSDEPSGDGVTLAVAPPVSRSGVVVVGSTAIYYVN
ncbi:hypothetical protein ACMYYO_00725 [Dermacoccaceae bacterium W4C1]